MPVGDVLVRDTGGDIEHDDTTLAVDVVSISQTAELLLSCGIPHVEADCTEVGREGQRVHLDTESGYSGTGQRARKKRQTSSTRVGNTPLYFFSNSPVK